VATDVAARGIDLPNLGLVIHADLPNDPEVMQHRSGRTGRAGRKGVSVLLVPPARRRRVELMLDQADIDAMWGTAPQAEEIRKLDQQRMLQDVVFTEESTEDDLTLARALLSERSPEDIAAALARLYRSRLPSPEDILDLGQGRDHGSGRSRDDRGGKREGRNARGDDGGAGSESRKKNPGFRHSMAQGSVWFRAGVGRRKNAEARWLLPMICRRGGIDKHDIGAIRIYESITEFEISAQAAEQFATQIKRPDKEEHIGIEAMPGGPRGEARAVKGADRATSPSNVHDGGARRNDKPHYDKARKHQGEPSREGVPKLDKKPGFDKKHRHGPKPAHGGKPRREDAAPFAKPAFGKKPKKNKHRG
jgi:ATP-dependent RNA helicase DeaD